VNVNFVPVNSNKQNWININTDVENEIDINYHGKHFGKHDHHNNGAGGQIDADFGQEKNDFIDSLIDFLEDLCDEPNGCDQSESDFDDIFDDYAEPITLKP